jgi:hypothetical protein
MRCWPSPLGAALAAGQDSGGGTRCSRVSRSRIIQIETRDIDAIEPGMLQAYVAALGGRTSVTISVGPRLVKVARATQSHPSWPVTEAGGLRAARARVRNYALRPGLTSSTASQAASQPVATAFRTVTPTTKGSPSCSSVMLAIVALRSVGEVDRVLAVAASLRSAPQSTSEPSPDLAWHRLMRHSLATIIAGRGLAELDAWHCWLPTWLPEISLAPLTFNGRAYFPLGPGQDRHGVPRPVNPPAGTDGHAARAQAGWPPMPG